MLRCSARSLRARAIAAGTAAAARRYSAPVVSDGLDTRLDMLTVEEQVWQIVHPSSHARIQRCREAASPRSSGGRQGQADARKKLSAHSQLDGLYERARAAGRLTRADYAAFLEGYNEMRDARSCVAVLRAMRESGERPGEAQFAMVLKSAADQRRAAVIFEVGEEMQLAGVEDAGSNYVTFFNNLLACLGGCGQIEHAYAVYLEMLERRLTPQRAGCHALVVGLGQVDEVELALEVLRESLGRGVAFGSETYLGLLSSASKRMHHAAYRFCYEQLTTVFEAQVTEGDYLGGLDVAARSGDIALASDVVRRLKALGYPLREPHFEPLFDALVMRHQWGAALRVLSTMREVGYGRTQATLRTLVRQLAADAERTVALCGDVFVEVAEAAARGELPRVADAVTLNALLAGLAQAGHVESAAKQLDVWFSRLAIRRNVDSYVAVLSGCLERRNKTVAEVLLAKLVDDDRLVPTQEIYELMVHLSLAQHSYEDAFVYLETMKADGMAPSWRVYAAIVRRCARVRDPRAQTAIREMRHLGYAVTPQLLEYVRSHSRPPRPAPAADQPPSAAPAEPSLLDILDAEVFTL
ncbi:hypothetical protein LPJ61_003889 [Coemansia biformis]|uniref:Pentatricopeptide repeat-containing protein-mitochondrial domain-containing protein n=1 Tax=Coemansia biformis TaxID=1286918 RepID=A0A9W7Y5T6_9FUNG|nr:hypothetical protein LPJ61_003889 [Coemansia biformis]